MPAASPSFHCDREAARPPRPTAATDGALVLCDAGGGCGGYGGGVGCAVSEDWGVNEAWRSWNKTK